MLVVIGLVGHCCKPKPYVVITIIIIKKSLSGTSRRQYPQLQYCHREVSITYRTDILMRVKNSRLSTDESSNEPEWLIIVGFRLACRHLQFIERQSLVKTFAAMSQTVIDVVVWCDMLPPNIHGDVVALRPHLVYPNTQTNYALTYKQNMSDFRCFCAWLYVPNKVMSVTDW